MKSITAAIAGAAVAAVAIGGVTLAVGANDPLYACVTTKTGAVRMVAAATVCSRTETKITWNVQGPAGAPGAAGATGSIGPSGPQGAAGATGLKGDQGVPGPQGPVGADGATGRQGPAGADGSTGPQGPAGVSGPTGPQGPAGADGATGPQGPTGAPGSFRLTAGGVDLGVIFFWSVPTTFPFVAETFITYRDGKFREYVGGGRAPGVQLYFKSNYCDDTPMALPSARVSPSFPVTAVVTTPTGTRDVLSYGEVLPGATSYIATGTGPGDCRRDGGELVALAPVTLGPLEPYLDGPLTVVPTAP